MPYKGTQVLPPVSENAGRKRQTGMSNHSVTLPPIQDNNKVVGGNTPMSERVINPTDSEHRRHQQPNRQENLHNYSNKDKIDPNNNEKYESNSHKKDIDQHKRSRSRSKERAPHKNHDTSVRSKSSAKGSTRRSRSKEKKRRSSSYSQRHRSNSRNKERTNLSKSRDSSRHRTRSSRRQHKSRESRKRSRSRDSSLRRKSKERRKSSRSKSQDQRRKRSSDRRKNKQRSMSRSSSRHGHANSEKIVNSRRRKHKSRSPCYESDSFRNDYLKDRRSPRSRNDDDIKYKHKSDASRSRKSKWQQYERSPSPEYHRDKTYSQSKRNLRNLKQTRSKIHHYYSDDSEDSYESVQSAESGKGNNKKRFGKSHDEIRLKSKLHANKHKVRNVPLDNEKKYNVIVLEDESEYSSSSEDESHSQKTIYVRSKSQHAAHLKEKRRRSKEYFSDIDTRQHKRPSDRKIIYYSEEPDEIIVQPRKRLEVPMAVRQVSNHNPSQNIQGEHEELFYLVPATNRTISNQQSQNNTLFNNQSEGQRVIRISNPTHQNTANHKLYYGNKSDVVYGQEPQYDDYRPPVQQKYYNPHTNHYRHDNVVPTLNIKDNSLTSHPTHSDVNRLNKVFDTATSSGRSPDGESSTSSGQSLESHDVNISSMSSHSNTDYRPTTAEKRKALKHLSELSNYNIDVAMGKASLTAPPLTDEALIKKIFNTEFQSQMDDYLRS